MRHPVLSLILLWLLSVPVLAQEGIQPEDYYQTVFVSDTEISPQGDLLAFTKTIVDEEDNSRHREVWMQQLRDGQPDGEPFRFTDPSVQSSSPRWSPDGSVLAIRSRRGDDPNTIRFLRVTAPGGEAFQLEGVDRAPVWAPDGETIAFVREPKTDEERPERAGWIAPDAITTTVDSARFDGRVITHMNYKRNGRSSLVPHPSVQEKRQLHVVAAEGGEPEILTALDFHVRSVTWAPDGERIYFAGDPEEDDEYNRDLTTNLYVLNMATGEPMQFLPDMEGSQTSPEVAPDGQHLAFYHTEERGAPTNVMRVALAPSGQADGAPINLTADWDLRPGGIHWTADGAHVRWSALTRGNAHLFEVSAEGGVVRQVTAGARRLGSISTTADGDFMAYTATDAVTPAEVFVARADGSDEAQLTNFNGDWLADRILQPAEPITWTVADGTEIEGWVVKPADYEAGQSYPMVLKIHGGPHSAYGNTWFQTFHALSDAGLFVFYPNPRGSSAYGHDFMYATRGEWGLMDEEDYMTGVDAVLEAYPDIDPDRIGVSGGSYGGYMTNWLTARFPDRFAAAVTSRSISNWDSMYGVSDAQGLMEYEFLGYPWEQRDLYRELSPMSYVENVEAPTLIIHSEEDYRTPMPEGEQWFMALKKREVPVEFVRYPRSSHGLSRTGEPWLLVDRMERLRSWFAHWLADDAPRAERTEQP